jgi:quinol monooxygenase YgiN
MVRTGLFVRLHAKPGQENALAQLLESGLSIVREEAATVHWFAVRFDARTFGIFDTFDDDPGRQAHLAGRLAAALMEKAPELLAESPKIEPIDVLAAKG